MKLSKTMLVIGLLSLGLASSVFAGAPVDEEAAMALAKKNGCLKCHSVDKTKKGPSYHKVAEKYKGKPDAEAKVIDMITTGKIAKFEDGSEEEHKIIETKDKAALDNLVQWILTR